MQIDGATAGLLRQYDNGKGVLNRRGDGKIADKEVRHGGGYERFMADVDQLSDPDHASVIGKLNKKAQSTFYATVQTRRLVALGMSKDLARIIVAQGAKNTAEAGQLLRTLGAAFIAGQVPTREFEPLASLLSKLVTQVSGGELQRSSRGGADPRASHGSPLITHVGNTEVFRDAPLSTPATWSAMSGLSIGTLVDNLKSAGLVSRSSARISIDYEHRFIMSYRADGGFTGSSSSNVRGKTEMASIEVLRPEGAGKGGVVRVEFFRPGHAGPALDGFFAASTSRLTGLYVVPDLSAVQGLEGDLHGDDAAVKQRLTSFFTSLEQNSSAIVADYTRGYGRVGTSYNSTLWFAGTSVYGVPGSGSAAIGDQPIKGTPTFAADLATILVYTAIPAATGG